ncbi:sulfatase-like hydrolase/transferase, partial [bacterium]|nr:sulfatase-like hydrolase/transferase [bacterium]
SLSKNIPTLAETLTKNGYHCEAVVANMLLEPIWGFKRGFQNYKQNYQYQKATKQTDEVCETIERLKNNINEPFFLFVHYMDPHAPYSPPTPFNKLYDPDYKGFRDGSLSIQDANLFANIPERDLVHLKALYSGEISYVDHEIKRILKLLDQSGLTENTITIITSDHGEEFQEHNAMGHGHNLYQELILVPLLVKIPEFPKTGIIHKAISLIDLAPSLVSLVGSSIPKMWKGQLLPGIFDSDKGLESKRAIFSDLGHVYALYSYPYKLLRYIPKGESAKQNFILNLNKIQNNDSKDAQTSKMPPLETMPLLRSTKDDENKKMPDLNSVKEEYSTAYDIEKDPQEITDIFKDPQLRSVMKNLEDMLIQHKKSESIHPPDLVDPLDEDALNQLKTLGYIQ